MLLNNSKVLGPVSCIQKVGPDSPRINGFTNSQEFYFPGDPFLSSCLLSSIMTHWNKEVGCLSCMWSTQFQSLASIWSLEPECRAKNNLWAVLDVAPKQKSSGCLLCWWNNLTQAPTFFSFLGNKMGLREESESSNSVDQHWSQTQQWWKMLAMNDKTPISPLCFRNALLENRQLNKRCSSFAHIPLEIP